MNLTAVPRDKVAQIWPKVAPLLQKATDTTGDRYGVFDIFDGLLSGHYVVWVIGEGTDISAAFTTRIIQYNKCKGLSIDWVGGNKMSEWLPMVMETIKKYAKENECTRLEGYGRKAWGRALSKYGWEPEYTAYKMELGDE